MALEAVGAEASPDIPMKEIDADKILEKVQKGQAVEYDHVIVRGDLDLSRERLQKSVTSAIRIKDSMFIGLVSFNGSTFEKPVDLSGSNFTGDAYFRWAAFSDYAGFQEAAFSGDADFSGATFSGDAYFEAAAFSGDANFGFVTFSGDAYFGSAAFRSYASFGRVTFSGDAYFEVATFSIYAGFWRATFSGDASFWSAAFSGDVDFEGADFTGNSSFEEAEFDGNIEFGDARFENETSFYRILFKRPAYFEKSSIESLNLTKADFGCLHLRWDDIDSLHFDEAAYLVLIKNYNTLGWYGDANRCYYDYRNAVRKNWRTASSTGFEARILKLFDLLIDYMEWLLYGYGVRPIIPISWSAIIILAFGLFFWHKRCLRKIIVEERIEDSKDASDEVLVKTTARRAEINALDPILFSLFTFTSGFTAFLHPTIEYKLERCLRWAIFERVLGPFFLALVITAISKTYLIR